MYNQVMYFIKNYAREDVEEHRAITDFMACENRESISSLRTELTGILQANPKEEMLDKTIGIKRKTRFGSYKEWAKIMLQWMAAYKE